MFVYGDGEIPQWALLGEYDNGSAIGKGRTEYIWLPTEDGNAIPIGMYRNGKFFAIHTDHLGTPRLMTDEDNKPVWQWPYSAFGQAKPTGVLKATPKPKAAVTNQPELLKATNPQQELNFGFPGWYRDSETNTFYNNQRDAVSAVLGRYYQFDPIGLRGGPNGFIYVGANPLQFIDPLGLAGESPVIPVPWGPELVDPNSRGVPQGGGGGSRTWCPPTGVSGVPKASFVPSPKVTGPYSRPAGAGPTPAQRAAVQGEPCVDCGKVTPRQVADHKEPLVVEYYRTGSNNVTKQTSVDAVQAHCPECSASQGGYLGNFGKAMRNFFGF